MLEIRNFTGLPKATTSQRHGHLARMLAENPVVMCREMVVRLYLELYPLGHIKANWHLLCRRLGVTREQRKRLLAAWEGRRTQWKGGRFDVHRVSN